MGFQVSCDRCGRFMKNVNGQDLKRMLNTDMTCKVCADVEEKIKSKIDFLKKQAEGELNKVHTAYKVLLIEAIQEQVAKNYGNTSS